MKRSAMLVGIGIIVLSIAVLGGLSLMDSESVEKIKNKTIPAIELDLHKQEKSVSSNVKCSSDAFGRIVCSP